jgi:hypothetical protein
MDQILFSGVDAQLFNPAMAPNCLQYEMLAPSMTGKQVHDLVQSGLLSASHAVCQKPLSIRFLHLLCTFMQNKALLLFLAQPTIIFSLSLSMESLLVPPGLQ